MDDTVLYYLFYLDFVIHRKIRNMYFKDSLDFRLTPNLLLKSVITRKNKWCLAENKLINPRAVLLYIDV